MWIFDWLMRYVSRNSASEERTVTLPILHHHKNPSQTLSFLLARLYPSSIGV